MKDIYEDILKVAASVSFYNRFDSITEQQDFITQYTNNETDIPLFYDTENMLNFYSGKPNYLLTTLSQRAPFQDSFILRRGAFGLIDHGNCWINKSNMLRSTSGTTGSSLSGDSGIVFGTGSPIYTNTQRFSSPNNLWSARLDNPSSLGLFECACLTFTPDTSLECYGGSPYAPVYSTTSSMYSDSQQSWTLKTQDTGNGRIAPVGSSLTSNSGIVTGGYISSGSINSCKEYQNSSDIWIAKTSYPINICYAPSASFNSNRCIIATGYSAMSTNVAYTYIFSSNSWLARSSYTLSLTHVGAASINNDKSIFSGGYIIPGGATIYDITLRRCEAKNIWESVITGSGTTLLPTAFEFQTFSHSTSLCTFYGGTKSNGVSLSASDSTVQFYPGSGTNYFFEVDQANNTCPVPISKQYDLQRSITLTNTKVPIKKILFVVNNSANKDIDDTTIGVSLDDGRTWKENITQDGIIDVSGLSSDPNGYYKLKVKTCKWNSLTPRTNIWTYKTDPIVFRVEAGAFSLGTDIGVYSCGKGMADLNSTDKYTISNSSFTSIASSNLTARSGLQCAATSITTDMGLMFGGCNTSTATGFTYTERYNNSINVWSSKTAYPSILWHGHCASINWHLVVCMSGWNGSGALNKTYTYANWSDSWGTRANITTQVAGAGLSQLNYLDVLVVSGMITESSSYYAYTQKFNYLSNSWAVKAGIANAVGRFTPFSGSLGNTFALFGGGIIYPRSNPSNRVSLNEIYSYTGDVWTYKGDMPYVNMQSSTFSPDADNVYGQCPGGGNHHLCYTHGHIYDAAFLVKVLE